MSSKENNMSPHKIGALISDSKGSTMEEKDKINETIVDLESGRTMLDSSRIALQLTR
jgi:hypothetical protein